MPASAKASKANKQRRRMSEYSSSASKAEFSLKRVKGTNERAQKKTELTGKEEVRITYIDIATQPYICKPNLIKKRLDTVLINSTDRLQKQYVRTQLAQGLL